jgi:hypothetical protein
MRGVLAAVLITVAVCGCGGPAQKARVYDCNEVACGKPVVYSVANGSMLIKPRMKYELGFSLHVLVTAEDHHKVLVPWAEEMRRSLSKRTLGDAEAIGRNMGDWQLGSLVAEYDGPDSIECIAAYVQADPNGTIGRWASERLGFCKKLGVRPEDFTAWYAGFLHRYWYEGFGRQWGQEHGPLVYGDAERMSKEIEGMEPPLIEFMEKNTGRKFTGSTTIIFYPSSFSRPHHAYGFQEKDGKAVIYRVGGDKADIIGSATHELLHPLIRGWQDRPGVKEAIERAAANPALRECWQQKGKGSYDYPRGWFDEMLVHGFSNYLDCKLGIDTPENARRNVYCSYEAAMVDAMFKKYESIGNIDDFAPYAITHIEFRVVDGRDTFVYVAD